MPIYPSNTATPRYYEEFRNEVLAGNQPICLEISLEMNRIDRLIADEKYYYTPRPVEAFIAFCEKELTKTDGSSFSMLNSFRLWSEQLFGWYYWSVKPVYNTTTKIFEEVPYFKRLINKQYLIVARGAAKSMYAAFIQAYYLVVDGETTHQIATAPTMKQAEEVLGPIRTAMTRHQGPVFKFLTAEIKGLELNKSNYKSMLVATKRGINKTTANNAMAINIVFTKPSPPLMTSDPA